MNENRRIALIAASILVLLCAAAWWLWPKAKPADPVAATADTPLSSAPAAQAPAMPGAEPVPDHYPVPAPSSDALPLPALGESDAPFAAAVDGLIEPAQRAALLAAEQLIRRLVATVDNLPRERLAINDRAFRRVPGEFLAKSRDGLYTLNPANEVRYVPLIKLAKSAGAANSAQVYLRFYPLFDKAYRELGNPQANFNDRLVQVIDHLLATPEPEGPVELVRPKVFYQFADAALESRSAGQKMLLRMGPVNRALTKDWLRQFRAAVTGVATPEG